MGIDARVRLAAGRDQGFFCVQRRKKAPFGNKSVGGDQLVAHLDDLSSGSVAAVSGSNIAA
jgi:hypothetical protein